MKYRVKIVDTTYDIYEVEAENAEAAEALAEEIHTDGGSYTECHVEAGCSERQVNVIGIEGETA